MLSEKESIIISHLRDNARKSLTEISRQTDIPVTTIYDIVNRLKDRGIIHRHVSIVDFSRIGFGVRVNIALKAENKSELLEFLMDNANINSIHKITGGYDFLVDSIFQNLADYEMFKERIEKFGLVKLREHHVVEEVKREGFNAVGKISVTTEIC